MLSVYLTSKRKLLYEILLFSVLTEVTSQLVNDKVISTVALNTTENMQRLSKHQTSEVFAIPRDVFDSTVLNTHLITHWIFLLLQRAFNVMVARGGSRAAATSRMEYFVIIVNGVEPLTIITKHSILDVAGVRKRVHWERMG